MNPLHELLEGEEGPLSAARVRDATAAALHALRHDRRIERLDGEQAYALARSLFQTPDLRTLAKFKLPWRPASVEREVEGQRQYVNKLLFKVVDTPSLADEGVQRLQRAAVSRGGQMRVTDLPFRALVYNRQFALIAHDFADSTVGAIAVREPGLIAALTELHACLWHQGSRWDQGGGPSVDLADVLAEMLDGGTDEASAQDLNVSLRTYRRKVQELLGLLGAQTRFQAGAIAEQRRYLDLVRPGSRPLAATPDPYLEALSQVRYVPS